MFEVLRLFPALPPCGSWQSTQFTWRRADGCARCGFCKGTVVRELQEAGHRVVVLGDGTSDRCAADAADFVFATRRLVDHCRDRGLPHRPFRDFHEVMEHFPAGG